MAKRLALLTNPQFSRNKHQEQHHTLARTGGIFVGREQEMTVLRAHLEDTLFTGHGRLVLLVGEAGIGKTRTAHELATHALARGARVITGRCYEGEGAPPFWPWVQIIRAYLNHCDLETLQTHIGTGAADIAQVIPEIRGRLPNPSPSPSLESDYGQFRFFDSFTTLLKNVARAQPLVVILDDLHWADASSLSLLQFFVQDLRDAPLLVIGTCRDVRVDLHHPLRQTLGALARESGSLTLHLHGLTKPEVASFIQQTTDLSLNETLITAVHQQTEGNPFFVTEVVRLLANQGAQPSISVSQSLNTLPIPQRVYDVLSRRLTALSGNCFQVLMFAAVIGRGFTLEVLTRASSLPRSDILQALEEALGARIISDDQQTIGSYSFSHALIREALYRELSLTQRISFHRKVGETLEDLIDVTLQPPFTELAYHFAIAAQSGVDVKKAVQYATQAGARAIEILAYEEAIKYYQDALRLCALHEPNDKIRCNLLLALGDAQRRAGQITHTRETFLAAANLARQMQHAQQFARAALGFAGLWVAIGVVDKAVVELLEEALAVLGEKEEENVLRARLYARLATEFWFATSRKQRVMLSQRAVQLARHTTDQKTLGYCLQAHHLALWGSPHLEERLTTTAEILHFAEQAGDRELALHGYSRRVADLLEAGDLFAVDTAIAIYARMAEKLRRPEYGWYTVTWEGMRAIMAGRFEEGERLAQQALSLGQQAQVSHDDAVLGFGIQLFTIRREQGRLSEMEASLKGFIKQYPAIVTFRCALAYLYSEVRQESEAREKFEELARQRFTDLPQDMTFPLSLVFLAQTCAFLNDTHRAAQLYALLLPYAASNVVISAAIAYHESVDYCLGLLATVLEKGNEAQTHFAAALAMTTRLGAQPRLAHTQYAYARMLLSRQQSKSEDQARAYTLLDSAFTIAQELGMAGLVEKVQSLRFTVQGKANLESSVQSLESKGQAKGPRLKTERISVVSPHSLQPTAYSLSQHSVFRHEGDYWTITYKEANFRLRHIRGLDYIAQLLRHPNREFHALDLVSRTQPPTTSGPSTQNLTSSDLSTQNRSGGGDAFLDAKARMAYKQRLVDLREELEEAHSFNDLGRVDRVQQEIDFLSAELARGLGLGGRTRTVASSAERARVNVAKGIKAALAKIAESSPPLEHYLATTIKTGVFCSYTPRPFAPIPWEF